MSLQARIAALTNAIGSEVKALFTGKQDQLVSGENIKTLNGQSLLGPGNLNVTEGGVATSIKLVTTKPLPVFSNKVLLPHTPIGDIIWNTALVYIDLVESDLDANGALLRTRDYQVQEHLVTIVDNELSLSSAVPDGTFIVVSYLTALL